MLKMIRYNLAIDLRVFDRVNYVIVMIGDIDSTLKAYTMVISVP